MNPREGLRLLTPPIVGRVARRFRRAHEVSEWEYVGSTWPPEGSVRGWNVASVVQSGRSRWPDLVRVAESSEPVSGSGLAAHNTMLCFAYALGRASSGRQSISFLDWGGGLGQYGLFARALYPKVAIEYVCRDLPLMAEAGRQLLPNATFYGTDEEALARRYDFVMASSSLQYVSDWQRTLDGLATSTEGFLFVTRQPFVDQAGSFVVVQRPAVHGYDTEYPGWVLNKAEFLSAASDLGLVLVREFMTGEQPAIPRAPEQPVYRGFLFERRSA